MGVGLQTWDQSGNQTLDFSTTVVKFIGILSIGYTNTGSIAQSGSLYVPDWATFTNNTPWLARSDGGFTSDGYDAVVWRDGNYLYWQYPRADPGWVAVLNTYVNRPNQTILYGLL